MVRFTKEQMFCELQTIFLYEADHLLLGGGPEKAEHFIGFAPGEAGEYLNFPPDTVNLRQFPIAGSFDRGFDYAFRPSVTNTLGEDEVQDLNVFMCGIPKVGGVSSGGETHPFMTADGLCRIVADTVFARWKLEWVPIGGAHRYVGHRFTTRELALLANMTEGAVRNALADKGENGLQAIPGKKNPILIDHAEAWRWLNGRRGFIPGPNRPGEDRFLLEQLQEIKTAEGLGKMIRERLWATFSSPNGASASLGWTPAKIEEWISGKQAFDADDARLLAQMLDMDAPLFVGKVCEVTLRRDHSDPEGER